MQLPTNDPPSATPPPAEPTAPEPQQPQPETQKPQQTEPKPQTEPAETAPQPKKTPAAQQKKAKPQSRAKSASSRKTAAPSRRSAAAKRPRPRSAAKTTGSSRPTTPRKKNAQAKAASGTPKAPSPKAKTKKTSPGKKNKLLLPILVGSGLLAAGLAGALLFFMKPSGFTIPAGLTKLTDVAPPTEKQWPEIYSGNDIEGIEALVQEIEQADKQWRQEADKRIDDFRKAKLELWISDKRGIAIPNAEVRIRQLKHQFHFGGVVRARRMVTGSPEQQKLYKDTYLAMGFNAGGFCNALKYKLKRGQERFLPKSLQWFADHNIPVRGHCLIWPGKKHLPHHIVKQLDAGDKNAVRQACDTMIAEWASKWDVIAWDVINETRGNHDIQALLGHQIIADWFRTASKHAVNPSCKLLLNENRVVSDNKSGILTDRMKRYRDEVRFLVKNNAPISGLGLQSRFAGNNPAEEIYSRLCVFDEFNLPITATEFELPTRTLKTEIDKARMLSRVMTVYFSHHLVDGIFQWTIFPNDDESREIVDNQGHPNLRGKMWLYLTKKHWHTDRTLTTDETGHISLRGFKGSYIVEVKRGDTVRSFALQLNNDTKAVATIPSK
jgi:GH35 family endo-1,4-beta-xylanase